MPLVANRAQGLSLERKLALLISGLLAAVIVIFGVAAWQQMREASVDRATERLARVAQQLAAGSDAGRARAAVLRGVAATPEVIRVAAGAAADSASLAASYDEIAASTPDSTMSAWELWGADEQRRAGFGAPTSERDAVALAKVRAEAIRTATTQRSQLYTLRDTVYYWTAVPVMADGRAAGVLAERRRLNQSPRAGEVVRGIVGDEVDVHLSSVGGGEWVEVGGTPAASQFALPDTLGGAVLLVDRAGVRKYAAVGAIAATPWVFVLSQPESAVLRRPMEFLRRLLAIGAFLLLAGAAAAWALGRHVARPLRDLTSAAESLAKGDYARRVDIAGGAEVARLSATFNSMAGAIGDAHRELATRNDALHEANEAKSRFLAMMSHELRTPLNAIGGYTDILELGLRGPVTPAQVDDLKRIRRSRDHLLSIISDILGFSRADAGHLTLNIRAVPV
ncbi:MAG: HAMP domain-containing protein, partial [Gemmatimonadaceae bacterium]|nr:HAMP domain-containing protein [Gemmatimonadaceae bacterium]